MLYTCTGYWLNYVSIIVRNLQVGTSRIICIDGYILIREVYVPMSVVMG